MELRTILYGYELSGQRFMVVPSEAENVRKIFCRYIGGETLKHIADDFTTRCVVYYKDKSTWSKNAICRIIENEKYKGNADYAPIIDSDLFDKAQCLKNEKGGKREADTELVQFLKEHVICAQCGSRYTRKSKWGNREKWLCTNGCHIDNYIDDNLLYSSICSAINRVVSKPEIIKQHHTTSAYEPSLDVIREEKEIARLRDQVNIQFHPIKQAIFDCTSAKFDCCKSDNSGEFTNALMGYFDELDLMESVDLDLMKLCVDKITVNKSASISIRLANEAEISDETEDSKNDYSDMSENNNEN